MRKFLLTLLCALTLYSCQSSGTYTPEFLTDSTIRLEVGKKTNFIYSAENCQYAYNSNRCEFRAHTDNMSDYFLVKLKNRPQAEGEDIFTHYVEWTEPNGMNRRKENITLKAVKIQDDIIWLWDSKSGLKLTILLP